MQIDLDHLLLSPMKGAKAAPFKTLLSELMSLPFPIIDEPMKLSNRSLYNTVTVTSPS